MTSKSNPFRTFLSQCSLTKFYLLGNSSKYDVLSSWPTGQRQGKMLETKQHGSSTASAELKRVHERMENRTTHSYVGQYRIRTRGTYPVHGPGGVTTAITKQQSYLEQWADSTCIHLEINSHDECVTWDVYMIALPYRCYMGCVYDSTTLRVLHGMCLW